MTALIVNIIRCDVSFNEHNIDTKLSKQVCVTIYHMECDMGDFKGL